MHVHEIMTKDVCCGSPEMNAAVAAEIMWTRGCGLLPIVEDGGRIAGVVTDRDLFIALGTQNRRPADLELRVVMHRRPVTCAPDDDIRQALKTMAKQHVHRILVVEQDELKGILSIDDVVARTGPTLKEGRTSYSEGGLRSAVEIAESGGTRESRAV